MSTPDELVADYLSRVRAALADVGCSASRAAEIVDEVTAHLREGRATLARYDEAATRELLDRTGSPDEIAAEAVGAGEPVLAAGAPRGAVAPLAAGSRRRPRRWHLEVAAAVAALAIIAGLSVSLANSNSSQSVAFVGAQGCIGQRLAPGAIREYFGRNGSVTITHGRIPIGTIKGAQRQLVPSGQATSIVKGQVIAGSIVPAPGPGAACALGLGRGIIDIVRPPTG